MKNKVSKFGIFLAIIFNLSIILFTVVIFITLKNNYFPKTIKTTDFENYMNLKGCQLEKIQNKNKYKGTDTILTSNSNTCPYVISYIVFNDKKERNNIFKKLRSDVFNNNNIKKANQFKLNLINEYYEYSTSGDYYKAVTLNGNTILYASAPQKYKTDIIKIFKDFGYTQKLDLTIVFSIFALALIIIIFYIICMWGTLKKTRNKPAYSLIPIFNIGCLTKDVFGSAWYVILLFITPIVNVIFILTLMYKLGRVFNKNKIYSILLAIFPTILWPLLAYDDSKYNKPVKKEKNKEALKSIETEIIKENKTININKENKPIEIKKENKIVKIFKWILTIILLLLSAILFLTYIEEKMIIYILNTIMFLIYTILACPTITNYTKKNKTYTNFKPWIITILIIIHFLIFCIFPA